jgi:hypothetical protein
MAGKKGSRGVGRLEREILYELSAGDMLYGFLLSQRSTSRMFKFAHQRAAYRYRQKLAIERLQEKGYITSQGEYYSLTKKGERALGFVIGRTRAQLGKKWDGKWRMVAFDVPEEHAVLRDRLRGILKSAGFQKAQQSVWLFPYDCQELIAFIQDEPVLVPHVLYGTVSEITNADRFKRAFKL